METNRKDQGSDERFVLQKVQPALLDLMDGSVSTLAPLFAAAGLTNSTRSAFFVGLAASVGAAISMGIAEALSDDGKVTGRGEPIARGIITGIGTAIGGMLHTFPFLISNLLTALRIAYAVVIVELIGSRAGDCRRWSGFCRRDLARETRSADLARAMSNVVVRDETD